MPCTLKQIAMAKKALPRYCIVMITLLSSLFEDTAAIVESYSPSLTGISFLPKPAAYAYPSPERYGSVAHLQEFYNGVSPRYSAVNKDTTDVQKISPGQTYDLWERPKETSEETYKKLQHNPDCPDHGMDSHKSNRISPQPHYQDNRRNNDQFRQYAKSLNNLPSDRRQYNERDYHGYHTEVPLDYELLNNYNDGIYEEDTTKNIYPHIYPDIYNAEPKYDLDERPGPTYGNEKEKLLEQPKVYNNVVFRKHSTVSNTYGAPDALSIPQKQSKLLSYQTRTAYDPWLYKDSAEISQEANGRNNNDGHSGHIYMMHYFDGDDGTKADSQRAMSHHSQFEKQGPDTFQTYDRRSLDFGEGEYLHSSRSRYPHKEIQKMNAPHYKSSILPRVPYEIFPDKFLPDKKFKSGLDSNDYTSSEARSNQQFKLNEDFKKTLMDLDYLQIFENQNDFKRSNKGTYKKGHRSKSTIFPKKKRLHATKTKRIQEKNSKQKEVPTGPRTRDPYAFDPCQQLPEGDYELFGEFRSLFPYAEPKCSFVKCANYRGYLNPCSTGTKNVSRNNLLKEGFCTEIDLIGECGYSMNRAALIANSPPS